MVMVLNDKICIFLEECYKFFSLNNRTLEMARDLSSYLFPTFILYTSGN